jgi:hypothetical protein
MLWLHANREDVEYSTARKEYSALTVLMTGRAQGIHGTSRTCKERVDSPPPCGCNIARMNKVSALLLLIFLLAIVSFSTWQLFVGNLEAAFSALPFLLIIYLFLKTQRK